MAAPYNPPIKAEDYLRYVGLEDYTNPGNLKANPTIAAGDFQLSKDGGAFANLTTLPAVGPASGRAVLVTLSSTEMDADNVFVQWVDQTAPKEWADGWLSIQTTNAGVVIATGGIASTSFAAGAIDGAAFPAMAEMAQGNPSATPDLPDAIMYLYMALRNASQSTATERRIMNNAGTVIAKAPMSDDGTTFDQGKLVTGP